MANAENYDALKYGPKLGTKIPHSLHAPDQTGKMKNFHALKGKNGLILLFSRSVGWCVYCKAQAVTWNDSLADVKKLGFNLALITYDPIARSALFSKRQNITYPILSDPKSEIIRAFDLLNKRYQPGSFAYGIPHPMIFVIDAKGIIRHRFSERSYRNRPEIRLILQVLGRKSS